MPMRRRAIGRGRPGLVGTVARTAVVAGTATAVSNRVSQGQAERAQQAADADAYRQQQEWEAQQAAAQQAAAPAPAASPVDVVGQLTQLAALRDQGVLTDAEFEAQKAKILAG